MKKHWIVLAFMVLRTSLAESLTLSNERVLSDVRLLRQEGDSITILHKTGGGTFRLSEFTPESRAWIKPYQWADSLFGLNTPSDDAPRRSAFEIVSRLSGYPSFRGLLAVRLSDLEGGKTNVIPYVSKITIPIRKRILKELYCSELKEEQLAPVLDEMKASVWEALVETDRLMAPKIEALIDEHIGKNGDLIKTYLERLRDKSKATGLFCLELKKIVKELEARLEPARQAIMSKYLTAKQIKHLAELEQAETGMAMDRVNFRTELRLADMWRRYNLFAPGLDGRNAAPLDLMVRYEIVSLWESHGVAVHYRMESDTFFPERWRVSPMSVKALPVDTARVYTVLPLIERFLSEYPAGIIRDNLSGIYLTERLQLYGKAYGGTYGASSIYSAVAHNPWFLLTSLHHEFSSILFRNYEFPTDEWSRINEPDWKYTGTGFEMLGRSDIDLQTEELLAQGFLVRYSQSSLENDVNVMSEWICVCHDELVELAARHSRIRKKYELLKRFHAEVCAGKQRRRYGIAEACRRDHVDGCSIGGNWTVSPGSAPGPNRNAP